MKFSYVFFAAAASALPAIDVSHDSLNNLATRGTLDKRQTDAVSQLLATVTQTLGGLIGDDGPLGGLGLKREEHAEDLAKRQDALLGEVKDLVSQVVGTVGGAVGGLTGAL